MRRRSQRLSVASTRLRVSHGGRGSRPAKNMLYSASSCLRSEASWFRSFWMSGSDTWWSPDQHPQQREPQFPGVRHRFVVDEHVGRIEVPDDFEEIFQRVHLLGIEPCAI